MNKKNMLRLAGALTSLIVFASPAAEKAPDVVNQLMASPVRNLSQADNDTDGAQRWVAWEEGTIDARSSHLALYEKNTNGNIQPVWSTAWPDAWAPSLLMLQEWRWHDRPLLAVTLQFGAAAEQVDIYGLDEKQRPQRLAEKTAATIGWKISASGQRLLVLYEAKPTVLKATCYGWQENTLAVQSCDK
ncbi:Lipoprotein [Kosakonia sp. BK9b]